jgi:hypothetical protein
LIDVARVLDDIPAFDRFCSVEQLDGLVASLPRDRFDVQTAGTSIAGRPIHHVRCGSGSLRVLVVAFPDPNEPIGGLTAFSLLSLLAAGHPELVQADVEWHVVPCIDPDGAVLNEGWSQQPFTLGSYMRGFFKQEPRNRVEWSFPVRYKRLVFDRPPHEAAILQRVLEQVRPGFYYSLHNAWTGGAFFTMSRDLGAASHRELFALLAEHDIAVMADAPHVAWCDVFADGVLGNFDTRRFYDLLEQATPTPEEALQTGQCSWEYLAELEPASFSFVTELPYVRHPAEESLTDTGEPRRRLKLRLDADNRYLVLLILEEWPKVEADLNVDSPLYREVVDGMIATRETLIEGLPSWPYRTRDVMFNPASGGSLSERDRFNTYLFDRFFVLCHCYAFVRLLRESRQSEPVREAVARFEHVFDAALREVEEQVDADRFEPIELRTLARVQVGSGLVALNALRA